MDVKESIAVAKRYVSDVYAEEGVTNVGLEEIQTDERTGLVSITIGFSRPWNTPRTRAQEVLESLGGVSPLRRSYKVLEIGPDGSVSSMRDRPSVATVG